MAHTQRLGFGALALVASLLACTEGTAPGSLGQLRVRPVFAPGEEPSALGVSPSQIHLVLRRSDGALVADTLLPYVAGETTSWLIELANPPESVGINADLGQGTAVMYTGSGQVSLAEGIGSSGTQHDLPVRYLSGPGAFSVDVSPDSAGIAVPGLTRQYTAVARDPGGNALTGFSFAWASSRPEVATVDATTGMVTAVAPGRSDITATSGGVVGSAVVTVGVTPASVTVSPDSALLLAGGSLRFTAVIRDGAGNVLPGLAPSWSSTKIDVATVSDSGVATAVSAGRTTVIARLGALADSSTLVVADDGTGGRVASIVVTPGVATLLTLGAVQQFTAVARNAQGVVMPGVVFTWTSSNETAATVNASGLATARAAGITTISASANGISGHAALSVSPPGPPVLLVVIPGTSTLTSFGDTQQFTAVAFDANGRILSNVTFSWKSSNPAVAPINAVGVATAVTKGSTIITATGGGLTGNAVLNVSQVVHSVSVNPPSTLVARDDSTPFTATAKDANGHVIPGAVFTWSTADPTVATVSATGIATGVGAGTTLVRATAGGVTGTASLSVVVVATVEIVGAAEQHVDAGATRQFTAVVRDGAGNVLQGVPVAWTVEEPTIASITQTGLATGLMPGLTIVRATVGNVTDAVELVVRP